MDPQQFSQVFETAKNLLNSPNFSQLTETVKNRAVGGFRWHRQELNSPEDVTRFLNSRPGVVAISFFVWEGKINLIYCQEAR